MRYVSHFQSHSSEDFFYFFPGTGFPGNGLRFDAYALEKDIEYLVSHGISRRHIYEVESIAMNEKILKAEGRPKLEEFPGLIPESLCNDNSAAQLLYNALVFLGLSTGSYLKNSRSR